MSNEPYPEIADYGLIGDCHTAALVSRHGSIDWCCLPRFDSDSCFGRLLDWQRGGWFSVTPSVRYSSRRAYLRDSLVLRTHFTCASGAARLTDFFAMRRGGRRRPRRELVRVLEGVRGHVPLEIVIAPRLDFGEVRPWIEPSGDQVWSAVGSNTGLRIRSDLPLRVLADCKLHTAVTLRRGERRRIGVHFVAPEDLDHAPRERGCGHLDAHLEETLGWWREWSRKIRWRDSSGPGVKRSAIVLKSLSYAPTGAFVAAPTTSLPESPRGPRNWDYRYCWVRDSVFTVHALANLGLASEADGFRRFIQRSAAGHADELQVLYGVDGKRRLTEVELSGLDGWRGARPVRIGNAAERQFQSDLYGMIVELSWRWSERGAGPDAKYWPFLRSVVECALQRWREPDRGIWEVRSAPQHFVHSKVMCWAAADGGIALAERYALEAPLDHWRAARDAIRQDIERHGVDRRRRHFVRSYGSSELDAALLLLPGVQFIDWADPLMRRTTDAIEEHLTRRGLVLRYRRHDGCAGRQGGRSADGLAGREGVFLPCTFWLAECLARQGRLTRAQRSFDRAARCANDLGLLPEEFDADARHMLGNFPQGLTHLAHISAALALRESRRVRARAQRRAG